MATPVDERLVRIQLELERQNHEWDRALRLLAGLGDEALVVKPEFFDEFDGLTRFASQGCRGVRV